MANLFLTRGSLVLGLGFGGASCVSVSTRIRGVSTTGGGPKVALGRTLSGQEGLVMVGVGEQGGSRMGDSSVGGGGGVEVGKEVAVDGVTLESLGVSCTGGGPNETNNLGLGGFGAGIVTAGDVGSGRV